ncbi:MAG: hypothetical protein CMC07_00525 [Flavobacteriaceae bacterium]|jgi:predicted esterase|nr:hypothetical protein [Flavobacteriaceae bacterium]|tara:strand:- start:19308 stop:21272 length:1965 start_codon:yes stop_codon:yes gene_type:complete
MHRAYLFLFFLIFLSYPVFSQETVQEPVPTEILFKKSQQYNFTISPNGKYFAEILDVNGKSDIIIIDIDNYSLLHRIPISDQQIDALYWLTNRRLLLETGGAIFAMDIDGSNSMMIVDSSAEILNYSLKNAYLNIRYNSLISLMPEKEHQILIETYDYKAYASIQEVNVFTGKKYVLYHGKKFKVNKWFLDRNREPRIAMRYKKQGVEFLKFNPETEKFSPFKIFINGKAYALDIDEDSFLDKELTFEGFGDHPDVIFLTSNIESDKRKLISYNIEKEEVEETVLEDVNCDVIDVTGEGLSFVYDNKNQKLAGVKYEGFTPQYKWFSNSFKKHYLKLSKQYPTFFNEFIDSDARSERIVVYQRSDTNSGNIGVYNTKDNSYSVMFHFNEELNEYSLSKTKSITLQTRDDYKLPCYLNLPVNYDPNKKYPFVVIPHGGPWARDYWGMEEFSQYFSSRGYITLRVNFRGSTGFGNSHMEAGLNSMDKIMIDDLEDATNEVIKNYNVDSEQVFIFGHSYGGYAVYMSLLKNPGLFVSGVAISAPTDIESWLKKQRKDNNSMNYKFWIKALGSKKSDYLESISPINYASFINRPMLILHGKKDEVIPVEQAKNMAKKLRKADKNVSVEILETEGHSISDSNIMGYVLEKSNSFFKNTK